VIGAARRSRFTEQGEAARGVLLGAGRDGSDAVLSDSQLSAHALILGASGAGKTTTLLGILTDQIRGGRPVVAIDMKGSPSFATTLADAAADAGRPFRLWTPDGPSHWNPLRHGNATELKDKLIATERFTEPHYQRAAERYVQNVLQVLQHAHPERAPTLSEVVELMDPARVPAKLRQLPRPLAERVQDYIAGITPDQLSAIRGLGTRLAIITESDTGQFLDPPSPERDRPAGDPVDLRRALSGREVVLFSLNSSTYGKLSSQLGTLAIQDLVTAVGDRLNLPGGERATIGIDEFSALGSDQVLSLLARGRESGVSVLLATQELADLDRAGKGLRDQVLGVTALKIAHRQDVPSSAQTIAQMAGTETVWDETRQIGSPFGRGGGPRGTRRLVEKFAIHPNEIRSLRTGEAVVITKLPRAQARIVRVRGVTRGAPSRHGPER
jgi:type IV secretory pathway TraG/TraD family ATPase VirD4